MQHLVVLIQHHHGTGGQAGQRAVGDFNAVVAEELTAAQQRQVLYVLQAFSTADARLGERQVSGDAQHDGVVQFTSLLVEGAHGSRAGRGIDAWEDVQHFALAGQGGQGHVGQASTNQGKRRCLGAYFRQFAFDLNRVAFESHLSHDEILMRGLKRTLS
ncbi:hypothetical protein D3C75_787660 [compost metagenome]